MDRARERQESLMTFSRRSIAPLVFLSFAACDPVILGDLGTSTTSTTSDDTGDDAADGDAVSPTPDMGEAGEVSSDDGPAPDIGDGGEASNGDPTDADSGGGFIDAGDGFPECDLYTQDCPPDEKCMPWADDGGNVWSGTRCVPQADDPEPIGNQCIAEGSGVSGIDNCAAGVVCYDVDPKTNEGICVGLCLGSPENPVCLDPETVCVPHPSGVASLCLVP
jgi:hypothetical protein